MSVLTRIRQSLFESKIVAAGQEPKKFLPEGALETILHKKDISECLRDPSFRVQHHKLISTVDLIFEKGRKILAILIEIRLECALVNFIEYRLLDQALAASEEELKFVLDNSTDRMLFLERQWDFLAYYLSHGLYVQQLNTSSVLPFVEQTKIGAGGFSQVYKVLVHDAHHCFKPEVKGRV